MGDALTAPFPLCSHLSHSVLHGVFAPKTLAPPNSQGHRMGLVPNGGVPGSPQQRCTQGFCSQHEFIPLNPPTLYFSSNFSMGKQQTALAAPPASEAALSTTAIPAPGRAGKKKIRPHHPPRGVLPCHQRQHHAASPCPVSLSLPHGRRSPGLRRWFRYRQRWRQPQPSNLQKD